jgi:gamma-D-glutamyl-L-lysine dipeptidyl-peptidase
MVVAVAVATLWVSPQYARPLAHLTVPARRALVGKIETQALYGERVRVVARRGAWVKVVVPDQPTPRDARGYPGWLRAAEVARAVPRVTVTAKTQRLGALRLSYGTGSPSLPRLPAAIVADARRFVGTPYLWGGTSAFGFDCSGLVHLVFKSHGIVIPRDADAQAAGGRPVARRDLRAGDLVFYGGRHVHHVALYVGGGRILEAPNSSSSVHVGPMRWNDYAGARRYL